MCLVNGPGVVPTGLDSIFVVQDPTLKRGTNKHCAYGASGEARLASGMSLISTGLDGILIAEDPTLKRGANERCAYGAGRVR
jgi:hypothetical protein